MGFWDLAKVVFIHSKLIEALRRFFLRGQIDITKEER